MGVGRAPVSDFFKTESGLGWDWQNKAKSRCKRLTSDTSSVHRT